MEEPKALHLSYHYVRDGSAPGPLCPPERLRFHIQFLQSHRYDVLTCGEVALRMRKELPLPDRYATLSFDDGLKDQWTTVMPILTEFGVPGTFFYIACTLNGKLPPVIGHQILIDQLGIECLTDAVRIVYAGTPYLDILVPDLSPRVEETRKLGERKELRRIKWMLNHWSSQEFRRDKLNELFEICLGSGMQEKHVRDWFMSADELRYMQAAGMEIASHSMTHPPFDISGIAEIEQECVAAQRVLADVLGRGPVTFAWPFGGTYALPVQWAVLRHYDSAWNFLKLPAVPPGPYNLADMPRLHEEIAVLS